MAVFVITERVDLGGVRPVDSEPAEFRWTVANKNIPIQPWSFGGKQRTKRTDYPGTDKPSEQILGPNYKEFTLRGRWTDKFNNAGYAVTEMNRFDAMCRRGNKIQLQFETLSFIGVITDWQFDYRRRWDIGYSFTVSTHSKADQTEISRLQVNTSGFQRFNARSWANVLNRINLDIKINQLGFPESYGYLEEYTEGKQLDKSFSDSVEEFENNIVQRVETVDGDITLGLKKVQSNAREIISKGQSIANAAKGLKPLVEISAPTGLEVLCFDIWNRRRASSARNAIFQAHQASVQADSQIDPEAIAIYQPQAGESLYSISLRFYGTPHNWRTIKERNRLSTSTLTGAETLVIPRLKAK